MSVVVVVPVLGRPEAVLPLVLSLRETSYARLLFVVHRSDTRECRQIKRVARQHDDIEALTVTFPHGPGDYSRKINAGVNATDEDWIFQGADDLRFHAGWEDEALKLAEATGKRVIGTNDLCNPRTINGSHSTHTLVHRSYIMEVGTVDEPGKLLHEGYWHGFCDDELVAAAQMRGEWAHARDAIVQHLHPLCAEVERDATYDRALDPAGFTADRQLFQNRRARVFGKQPAAGRRTR